MVRPAARRALKQGVPSEATVVVVSWNSLPFLKVTLDAVRRLSPSSTRILVVDNGSRDGSRPYLKRREDVQSLLLPANLGHETAMDLGFLRARTEFVVALDVDAFPITSDWLSQLIRPLRDGYRVSGAHHLRFYVHPCCMAMRLKDFVHGDHTFLARRSGHFKRSLEQTEVTGWDTGELISLKESPALYFFDRTEVRGPGALGTVFGDLVYHNFYSTRHLLEADPDKATLDDISRREALDAWSDSTRRYLG
jgi:glycosyltransferase involved in cell wall biosynthesis